MNLIHGPILVKLYITYLNNDFNFLLKILIIVFEMIFKINYKVVI